MLTFTAVPRGCGERIGIDRDADGILDRDEIDQGSDPADPESTEPEPEPELTRFRRGDVNSDGRVDVSDPVASLDALFVGQVVPPCLDASDSNDDGRVDITDPINTLSTIFLGMGNIPLPGMSLCGDDPTEDGLECETPSEDCR